MTDDEIYYKLIAEKRAADPGPYDFDGNNCDDIIDDDCNDGIPCDGWDGESHRCNCGNRRVSWVLSDCKTYIYAEAH